MSVPADLEKRGRDIWVSFDADRLPAGHRALVHEIARSADTLDRLDGLVMGRRESWATLVFTDMGEVTLEVNGLLAERRQQQANLKQLLSEARQAGLKQGTGELPKDEGNNRGATIHKLRSRLA